MTKETISSVAFALWEQLKLRNNSGPEKLVQEMKEWVRVIDPKYQQAVWQALQRHLWHEAQALTHKARSADRWATLCMSARPIAAETDI